MDGTDAKTMGGQTFSTGLLIVTSLFLLTGMGRYIKKDRSADPLYSWVIGMEYQTKDDFVLYKHGKREKMIFVTEFGQMVPTREEIGKTFPYKDKKGYENIILGVLPAGSVFRVESVEEKGHSSATFIHYYARVISSENKEFVGKQVSPTSLTNQSDPPRFEEELVEELHRNH